MKWKRAWASSDNSKKLSCMHPNSTDFHLKINFCNSDTVYILLTKKDMMETFKEYWASQNGCRLLNELGRRNQISILNRFFLKTSLHCLISFTFVNILIHWLLSPTASSVSWCWSCFVCSGLTYEIFSGGGTSTYIYCVDYYSVIKVLSRYTLKDDSFGMLSRPWALFTP